MGGVLNKTIGIKEVIHELDHDEQESIYIGDMISDIQAAKAVPVSIIALSRGYHTRKMLEPHKPDDIWEDLTPFLEKI